MTDKSAYPEWGKWVDTRMRKLNVSAQSLSRAVQIKEGTLKSYRSGARLPGTEKQEKLAPGLQLPNESLDDTLASMQTALRQRRKQRDFYGQLNAETLTLKISTLRYPPFAAGEPLPKGEKLRFVDRFFERFLRLSVIKRTPVGQYLRFQLRERTNMLIDGECHISTNLLGTLSRLKQLHFYWFPIRISIGAVCLRHHQKDRLRIAETLAVPHPRRRIALWPILIPSEVGAMHVQHSLGLDLPSNEAHFVDDLNPKTLARHLKDHDTTDRPACIVTDEITALAVAGVLGKEAMLVFPLTTAHAVETSHHRRELPAHVLGAAVNRRNKDLREFLDDTWTAILTWERDATASNYATLYRELTDYVKEHLSANPFIVTASGDGLDLADMDKDTKGIVLHALATAYSRRALHLDRRSIETYIREGSPWGEILQRARDTVLVREAQNRFYVRERVLHIIKETFGEEYSSSQGIQEVRHLLPLIEQEFDVGLGQSAPSSIEVLTTAIQQAMEQNSLVTRLTHVNDMRPGQESVRDYLHAELSAELKEDQAAEEAPIPCEEQRVSLLAVYRGEFVGCLDVYPLDAHNFQLRNLYVKRVIREHGVGRILIRAALERVTLAGGTSVMIDLVRLPRHREKDSLKRFFELNGFRGDSKSAVLRYTLLVKSSRDTCSPPIQPSRYRELKEIPPADAAPPSE